MVFIFLFLENEWDLYVCMYFKDTLCLFWWVRIFGLFFFDRNSFGREMFLVVFEVFYYFVYLDVVKWG